MDSFLNFIFKPSFAAVRNIYVFEKGTSFRIINITVFFVHNNATVKQLPRANVTGLHKKFTENRTFRYCKDSFI